MKPIAIQTLSLLLLLTSVHSHSLPAYSETMQTKLKAALAAKGSDYRPRTEHLLADGQPKYLNRLILEDSPYLIQHAHNPVNWYAWGEEAFAVAKRENKPVFLSIGYSTCHWCHVMERESFDNPVIAEVLNRDFISIKVDREQRPDVDETYMTAVMLMTGRGGWPMSNFITPEGKTFYAGTYFNPQQFQQVLMQIHETWISKHNELLQQADRVAAAVAQANAVSQQVSQIDAATVQKAADDILHQYDAHQGGFGPAPKFPNEPYLFLLLDRLRREAADPALAEAVVVTLKAMAQGGIYDQVGGGFHRYATDDRWLVPHFEKMLYNQAHMARIYLQAYQLTGDVLFKRIVRQTLDYVLREMTAPDGGFYSATDADSEDEEGLFFVWTESQLKQALTPEQAQLAIELFSVTPSGNFEGRNILYLPQPLDSVARRKKLALADFLKQLDPILKRLREAREARIHPLRDDKILTAWNGMMITTLARAGDALQVPKYLEAAKQAADFIWQHNREPDGQLWRAHLNGSSSIPASEEDYAYFAEALLTLYDISGQAECLARAVAISDTLLKQFWDMEQGGLFMNNGADAVPLMVRPKNSHDGAIPSGNSVALNVLTQLANRTHQPDYMQKAQALLAAFSGKIAATPSGYAYMLLGANNLRQGESSDRQYAAQGAIAVHARMQYKRNQKYDLKLTLAMGHDWHIHSSEPMQKELIPTQLSLADHLSGWKVLSIAYPQPELKTLGFQRDALSLYRGNVTIEATLERDTSATGMAMLQLRLQACNHESCLPPERLHLTVSAHH